MWVHAFLLSVLIEALYHAHAAAFVPLPPRQRAAPFLPKQGKIQAVGDVEVPLGSTRASKHFSRTGEARRHTEPQAWAFQVPPTIAFPQHERPGGGGLNTLKGNRVARAHHSQRGSQHRLRASESGGRGQAFESPLSSQGTALPSQNICLQSSRSGALLPPRGFRDFPPSMFAVHKHIFSVWREVAEESGFQEYKGPSVESCSLYPHFKRQASKHAGSSHATCLPPHIYKLQGSEGLCLVPEVTPSLVRMLQREELHRPSAFARRWFCIERVWRHERPGLGRRREHFQLNLDIAFPSHLHHTPNLVSPASSFRVKRRMPEEGQRLYEKKSIFKQEGPLFFNACGLKDFKVLALAELIATAVRIFQKVGLEPADVRIRVGSRSLLCALLSLLGFEANHEDAMVHACKNQASLTVPLAEGADPAFNESFDGRMDRALRVLDRAGKRSRTQTEAALGEALGISSEASGCLLERIRSFDVSDDAAVHKVAASLPLLSGSNRSTVTESANDASALHAIFAPVEELRVLLWLLQEVYAVREWVDVDLLIVRGLHYYTGIVFEAFDAEGAFRAILGGGCYGERLRSSTCTRATRGFEGAGLGMGDCVLLELLQRKHLLPPSKARLDVVVVLRQPKRGRLLCNGTGSRDVEQEDTHASQEIRDADRSPSSHSFLSLSQVAGAQALCKKLRAEGLRVELLLPPHHSTRASLRRAQSVGAKAVVFVAAPPETECNRDIRSAEGGEFVGESEAAASPGKNSAADERGSCVQLKVILRQSNPKGLLRDTQVASEGREPFESANADSTKWPDSRKPAKEAFFEVPKVFDTASHVAAFLKSQFHQS
ncbi:hypothetical protein ACSSS7_004904 [Eimeria intestinalis]